MRIRSCANSRRAFRPFERLLLTMTHRQSDTLTPEVVMGTGSISKWSIFSGLHHPTTSNHAKKGICDFNNRIIVTFALAHRNVIWQSSLANNFDTPCAELADCLAPS